MFLGQKGEPVVFNGIAEDRKSTDRCFSFLLVIVIFITVGFVGYSLFEGELARIMQRYDDCGNFCGEDNPPNSILKLPCKNLDLTDKKYLYITNTSEGITKECVASCPAGDFINELKKKYMCVEKDVGIAAFYFLKFDIPWVKIFVCTAIALAIALFQILMFRILPECYACMALCLLPVFVISSVVYLWVLYSKLNKEEKTLPKDTVEYRKVDKQAREMFLWALIATVALFFLVCMVAVMCILIKFLLMVFKEAAKVITDVPLLFLLPFCTIISLILTTSLYIYFNVLIWSSMSLKPVANNNTSVSNYKYEYAIGGVQIAGFVFNFFTFLWTWQFIIDCQYFIVASTVSQWFFTRDKSSLESPIKSSCKTLYSYHLGTTALGSLLITLIRIMRMIINVLQNMARDNDNFYCIIVLMILEIILMVFESLMRIITKNAYIIAAIYGYSFVPAGKQAFHLLTSNFNTTIAIDGLGDMAISMCKILVVLLSTVIGYMWLQGFETVEFIIYILLILTFSYIIADTFNDTVGATIETIYLCFCIDAESNDGVKRPYFMTTGMMEFMEEGKKFIELKEEEKRRKEAEQAAQAAQAEQNNCFKCH